jgi:4-aminobutyrate aminotransferase/4-aminobutyrate aminotransferase/(S)-3-amino-2-methylpropionate transaminase
MGHRLRERLAASVNGHPYFGKPHGLGLMIGMTVQDHVGSFAAAMCDSILETLKDHGVLAGKTGPGRNVLTFMPPLTISDDEADQFLDAFRATVPALI